MSLKRSAVESVVRFAACFARNSKRPPVSPRSIFVLRNNDMGDLLIVTPIFEALKKRFPSAQIFAGTGSWNLPILLNNPYVDQVIEVNAPWHNKFTCKVPHRSIRGLMRSLSYIWRSPETEKLKTLGCDIGIDVLGSPEGSLLMMRVGIPWRLGVNGYAGGHSVCQQTAPYDETIQVGRAALRFAELLGVISFPESRPQIFLTQQEKSQATETWFAMNRPGAAKFKRILIAPGGGVEKKCWPRENYRSLATFLASQSNIQIAIVGSQADCELGEYVRGGSVGVTNLCGKTSLRETFALAWESDAVACNSSMIMHAAAAFDKPTIVFLGETFDSAQKHKLLWGYGANDLHLGREPERNRIFTPEEAMPIVISHFSLCDLLKFKFPKTSPNYSAA
jgi:ADP-heptose:LPS heptosyltransferase